MTVITTILHVNIFNIVKSKQLELTSSLSQKETIAGCNLSRDDISLQFEWNLKAPVV